jgi:hypothetical protein
MSEREDDVKTEYDKIQSRGEKGTLGIIKES